MKFRECTIGDHSNCILETKTEGKCSCICHCPESFESYMKVIESRKTKVDWNVGEDYRNVKIL